MNITTNNNIKGFEGKDMVILKTYIYRQSGVDMKGDTYYKYLTLFTLVPSKEYQQNIKMDLTNRPGTIGVFVKLIGSLTGLVTTYDRVLLADYQKMLKANGWEFVTTVMETHGVDFEVARKRAWTEIVRIRKGGDKKRKELVNDLKLKMYDLRLAFSNGQRDGLAEYINNLNEIVNEVGKSF